jgi:hypothetical protein
MTIPSEVNRSGPYTGNGVTTAFDYKFKVYSASDIQVIVTDLIGQDSTLALGANYSVTNVGADGGGQVVLTTPLTAGYLLTNLLDVSFKQDIDLENQGAYYAESVERGFDLAVMRDQQLDERLSRAVVIPPSADKEQLDELIADILRLGASAAQVDTVAAIRDQVLTVAGISAKVSTVSGISAQVSTVSGIAANVNTVAGITANIAAVVANQANINIVAGDSGAVTTVAADIAKVKLVAADLANVDAVVANKPNIDAVAGINNSVSAVAAIAANVTAVVGMSANIAAVVANKANVDAVGGNIANVNTVAANNANVTTVAGIAAQVQTVATNAQGVKDFGDVYQGAKAVAPTKRSDNTNLQAGDMYFDTVMVVLRFWDGAAWQNGYFDSSLYYTKGQVDANFGTTAQVAAKLNSSAYTAADVLAKLLTVDGAGSGLDADTLDGISSAGFMAAGSRAKPLRSDGAAFDVVWTGQGPLTYVLSSNDGVNFYPVASSYFYKTTDIVTGDVATFPVGTYLLVLANTNPGIGRGGGYNLATTNAIQGGYTFSGFAGAVTGLAGAWVSRGSIIGTSNNYYYLMQRYG